jgi:hypothetical protein
MQNEPAINAMPVFPAHSLFPVYLFAQRNRIVYTLGTCYVTDGKNIPMIMEWIRESSYYPAISPFLENGRLEVSFTGESVDIRPTEGPAFCIFDEYDELYYSIPYHENISRVQCFKYFALLYTCNNQYRMYPDNPEFYGGFVEWVYRDMVKKPSALVSINGIRVRQLYPCTIWKLDWRRGGFEEEWQREEYVFTVVEQTG